jgi:hypothetical protein
MIPISRMFTNFCTQHIIALYLCAVMFVIAGCVPQQSSSLQPSAKPTLSWQERLRRAEQIASQKDQNALLVQITIHQVEVQNKEKLDYTFIYISTTEPFAVRSISATPTVFEESTTPPVLLSPNENQATYQLWNDTIKQSTITPEIAVAMATDRLEKAGQQINGPFTISIFGHPNLPERFGTPIIWSVRVPTRTGLSTITFDPITGKILAQD